jgi:hypothetical protein
VAVDFADVVDPADVGVRDPPRNAHFILEALEQSLVACGLVWKKLEGYGLAESEIVGAVNLAHPAFSEQRNDAVAPGQQAPRKESAFVQVFGGARSSR